MEERENLIILYEYYGKLLKPNQQKYFIDYYFDNLTMEEIAENNNVSKNLISKQLMLIKDKLYNYESVLELYKKNNLIRGVLSREEYNKIIDYI